MRKKYVSINNPDFELPSRSELKRQSTAIQKLGEDLAKLSPALWRNFSISPQLLEALSEYNKIKSRESKRRQLQFIGKLMRTEDSEKIAMELEQLKSAHSLHTARFHDLEQLRDQILQNEPDVWEDLELKLVELRHDLPLETIRYELRMIHQLAATAARKQDKASTRALFRALRKVMDPTITLHQKGIESNQLNQI